MEIKVRLNKNFQTQYNKWQAEFGTEIAKLNGFDDDQLSYTDFISNFIDIDTVADASVDSNSNVARKTMNTLMNEMPKPHRKLLAYNKIYYEIQKKFGYKAANNWFRMIWTYQLYMHDADTSSFKSYCYAYDLKDLAEKGLWFLSKSGNGFNNKPAQHLITFIDFVKEFISYNSNLTSGACGLPNLIPYMFYFWKKDCNNHYMGINSEDAYKKYAKSNIQRFIYAVNQPYVRDSIQSAFTNTSVFDRPYFEALFGAATFPDGSLMIDYEDEIIEFQKWYLEEMSDIRQENMFTFPVNTISLLRTSDNKGFVDEDFARWAIQHNMKWSDSNIFCDTTVNSLSNCCRLKSDITELYFNSIGGTALQVGSVKVSTINLARLALDSDNTDDYLEKLYDRVYTNCMGLDAVRHIIQRNVEKGLLPNFSYGLINFKSLYNTTGVIGIYETMKHFGFVEIDKLGNHYYTKDAEKLGKDIFDIIRAAHAQFIEDYNCDYKFNIEQIPGEQSASKLIRADKFFYPDADIYELPLYGNQFMPLGIKTTLQERVRVQALFDGFCNGGSILHANIDAPFDSFEKAWKVTNWIAEQGVTYFAFNTKIQACEDNHAFYGTTCPICGKPIATEYSRVVGFFTPIKSWTKDRKKEYNLRRWEGINTTVENI